MPLPKIDWQDSKEALQHPDSKARVRAVDEFSEAVLPKLGSLYGQSSSVATKINRSKRDGAFPILRPVAYGARSLIFVAETTDKTVPHTQDRLC